MSAHFAYSLAIQSVVDASSHQGLTNTVKGLVDFLGNLQQYPASKTALRSDSIDHRLSDSVVLEVGTMLCT